MAADSKSASSLSTLPQLVFKFKFNNSQLLAFALIAYSVCHRSFNFSGASEKVAGGKLEQNLNLLMFYLYFHQRIDLRLCRQILHDGFHSWQEPVTFGYRMSS